MDQLERRILRLETRARARDVLLGEGLWDLAAERDVSSHAYAEIISRRHQDPPTVEEAVDAAMSPHRG